MARGHGKELEATAKIIAGGLTHFVITLGHGLLSVLGYVVVREVTLFELKKWRKYFKDPNRTQFLNLIKTLFAMQAHETVFVI